MCKICIFLKRLTQNSKQSLPSSQKLQLSSLVSCLCLFIDKCQKAITLQSTVQTGTLWTGEKVSTNNMIILMMTFANMEKILLIVKLK